MNIKEILDFEIHPRIFAQLPAIFSEFGFKAINSGYISTTGHKTTGEKGKPGKVYCYANNISFLKDFTRGGLSIWDYVQRKEGLNSNADVLKRLAALAGVELPELDPKALERIKASNRRAAIWETANDFFISSLQGPTAEKYREYLNRRGYTLHEVKDMGLGFLESQEKLKNHLYGHGFTSEEIDVIKLTPAIGKTHRLVIPYRAPSGRIRGIASRNIDYKKSDKTGKYLYSSNIGTESLKKETLFNLSASVKGDGDLIFVEGLIDCLISSVKGIPNVVALGGTSLNAYQVNQAIRNGTKKVTLALDNDRAGIEATRKAIDMLKNSDVKIYVAQFPDGIKDPDELIKEQGIEAFKSIIETAAPFYTYKTNELIKKYNLDSIKDLDRLKESLYSVGLTIKDRTDLDLFCTQVETATGGIISRESFQAEAAKLREQKARHEQAGLISELMKDASKYLEAGHIDKARGIITQRISEIKTAAAVDLLPASYTFDAFQADIKITPANLITGISNIDKICKIPVGQITLIAGRTSHGKTALMLNILLSMSEVYQEKTFLFFTYEEERKSIVLKLLNILLDSMDLTDEEYKPIFSKYTSNGVTNLEILKGYFKDGRTDFAPIEEAKGKLQTLIDTGKIRVIDKNYSVEELTAVIQYMHGKNKDIAGIFVDYAQKIKSSGITQDKRIEIGEVSSQINNTAKLTGLPVVMGAQLNRTAGSTGKNKPAFISLEALKETGNLEEDANLVLGIYMEAREPGFDTDAYGPLKLEITALKNRDGIVNAKTFLNFARETRKISNCYVD